MAACAKLLRLSASNINSFIFSVEIPDELLEKIPADRREALKKVLEQDPRPSYQNSEERIYGLSFAGMEIKFQVKDQVLHVVGAERAGT